MNGEPDCPLPPPGWYCSKPSGHEGPCPAWPKDHKDLPPDMRAKFYRPDGKLDIMKVANKLFEPVVQKMVTERHRQTQEALGVLGLNVSRETSHYAYAYHAEILRWVDGDTVEMRAWKTLDFGFGNKITGEHSGRFRLTIVDTPERGQHGYHEAIEFVNDVLPVGTVAQIRTYRDPDNFGRYLADIQIPGEGTTSISSKLLEYGLATVWD